MLFRHPSVRPHQKELMEDMRSALESGGTFMAQAPTGMGKTDAALSAALTVAMERGLDVFFLTPKISQHRIALEAVRGISEKHSLGLRAVDMVGRMHCCIDGALSRLDSESFQSACARRRKKQECVFYGNARGYGRAGEMRAEARFREAMAGCPAASGHEELIRLGTQGMCCPYEWLLRLGAEAEVVIADYFHVLVPKVRDVFLNKVRKRLENSIVIVDEAHNLAPRIRDSMSSGVSSFTFVRVRREMRFLGLDSGPVDEEFALWAGKFLEQDAERVVPPHSLDDFVSGFGLTAEQVMPKLAEAGFDFVDRTGKKSACLRLAGFLASWKEGECVRVLKRKHGSFFLSKRLLDPSPATRALNGCAGAVLMSGTLLPLQMHRDILGLDPARTVMKAYPSPFSSGTIVNMVTPGLTTRYSRRGEDEYAAIAERLDAVIAATPGGTAVFFPSYVVMDAVLPLMRSAGLLVQKSGMRPHEVRQVLKEFRQDGGVLCGVQGGSLAEGVDYCAGEIKTVAIVGVALEEMGVECRALIDYYDEKFGRGWDYGYIYPGTIKALQAAGRARRKEGDRVAVVYMDERFRWSRYSWILNRSERLVVTPSPESEVARFWKSHAHVPVRS